MWTRNKAFSICPHYSFKIPIIKAFQNSGYENNYICPEGRKRRSLDEEPWNNLCDTHMHMTSTLRGVKQGVGWWSKQENMRWYRTNGVGGGGGLANILPNIYFFLLKKIGFVLWPDIVLSQKLTHYWQEIFLLTLTLDSDTIL